jgi:hypothetical protein
VAIGLRHGIKPQKVMLERIKYNFWLLVFVLNTLFFLFFLYQAISFTSVYAYRWLFFLSTPFFTSGIHLLIKSRSTKAEWLSVINFLLTAFLIIYFNALPDALETRWTWFIIPVFNQLFINSFDVIWTNQYKLKVFGVSAVTLLWLTTCICVLSNFLWLTNVIIPLSIGVGIILLGVILIGAKAEPKP